MSTETIDTTVGGVAVSDTLVVSARALADPVAPSAAGLMTVIDLSQGPGERDLAELLGRTAGFQVRRYGGLGFAAVPSLRGSAAAQIRLFIDGLPLADAQSGAIDLSTLPVERFARAEVYRGVVPGGLGGLGGAGAVNLVTRPQSPGLGVGLFSGGDGSLGGRATWGTAHADGRRSLLLMAHGRRADNDYEFLDNRQTFANAADDTTRLRRNAWFKEWGLWGSGRLPLGPADLRLSAGWFRKDGGRPGPINDPSAAAAVRLERGDGQIHALFPHQLALELSADRMEQVLLDPQNEVEDGFGGEIRSLSTGLTGRLTWSPPLWLADEPEACLSRVSLIAGAEAGDQAYRQWYGAAQDPRRTRTTRSAFASLPVSWFADRLQVIPAWRYQRSEDDFPPLPALPWLPVAEGARHVRHHISPSLGLVWELQRDTWWLEAHGGQSVREPTWVELFGHRGGIDGNRELAPEELTAADLAVVWHPYDGGSLRLAGFWAESDQTIVFVQNSPGTSHARNIGATRNRGLELEGQGDLGRGGYVRFNATWQRPVDAGEIPHLHGNRLPYLSDLELAGRVGRAEGPWRPWVEFSLESERYRDQENTELIKAPTRIRWNVGLTRRLGRGLTASLEIINLTDDRTYDIVQFPLPGRTWQLALQWNR